MAALIRVGMWWALLALATALVWLASGPFRVLAWVLQRAHQAQDAAEIEFLLAQAWHRTVVGLAEREGRCPVQGVCMGRGDCKDSFCPGRGRG